jgi:hypothetical protein
VYDESQPASSQPQTPQNLPEARHRSHYHPSYTAPEGSRARVAHRTPQSGGQHRHVRSDSPVGLDTPGFRGLYGGRENGDDEVMFEQASQRLFQG